jgi:uncharacterized protein YaiL (DUF2058 family)
MYEDAFCFHLFFMLYFRKKKKKKTSHFARDARASGHFVARLRVREKKTETIDRRRVILRQERQKTGRVHYKRVQALWESGRIDCIRGVLAVGLRTWQEIAGRQGE